MNDMQRKKLEDIISDMVRDLFYYDRKEDDDLTVEDMENLTDEDKDFIIETFNKCVKE